MNNGRPTGRADTPQGNYIERREASDSPYDYRPTPIDSEPQQQRFLPGSLPSNNTSPLISNRTTNTHQGLATIEESEMPYEYPSGKFIMNPEAPVFVPGQRSRPGMLVLSSRAVQGPYLTDFVALRARNPRDWVYQGVPPPKPAQDNQVLSSTGKIPAFRCPYRGIFDIYYRSMLCFTNFVPVVTCLQAALQLFSPHRRPTLRASSRVYIVTQARFLTDYGLARVPLPY